jgi:hypothetical protein
MDFACEILSPLIDTDKGLRPTNHKKGERVMGKSKNGNPVPELN